MSTCVSIDEIANKVADILMERFDERELARAEALTEYYWNTPIKTTEDYEKELAGKTVRQVLEELKNYE